MTPSPKIIAFIKGFEGFRATAYLPTPNDVPTIGYGSTGHDIHLGMTWTREQCDARFAHDLTLFAAGVEDVLDGSKTSQAEFDALVSFAYNVGLHALEESTLLRLHKAGDRTGAAGQFQRWSKQAGKTLPGLLRRRNAEALIYQGMG